MFTPETPSPSQYRPKKTKPVVNDNERPLSLAKALAWAFIFCGLVFIIAIIRFSPEQGELVCDSSPGKERSLISFGSCHREKPYKR